MDFDYDKWKAETFRTLYVSEPRMYLAVHPLTLVFEAERKKRKIESPIIGHEAKVSALLDTFAQLSNEKIMVTDAVQCVLFATTCFAFDTKHESTRNASTHIMNFIKYSETV